MDMVVEAHSASLVTFFLIVRSVNRSVTSRSDEKRGVPELEVGKRTRPAHKRAGPAVLNERDRLEVTHPSGQVFDKIISVVPWATHELKRVVEKRKEEDVGNQNLRGG